MNVVFRVDASLEIGIGHVMRCLTLANAIRKRSKNIVFVCREHEGHLAGLIESRGFACELLPQGKALTDQAEVLEPARAKWLGVTWEQDANETVNLIGGIVADCLIVDHYGLDYRWHRAVGDKCRKLFVIDDLADRRAECDFLLDQNFYLHPDDRYRRLVSENCQMLLGPRFALLRDEFLDVKRQKSDCVNSKLHVFVFMGGVDITNETGKVVNALTSLLGKEMSVSADVIVGPQNPHAGKIEQLCDNHECISFYKDVQNMAKLMSEADISVGAGGSTTLERCYLGLPSLVTSIAENQIETTTALASIGAIIHLGWYEDVGEKEIIEALENMAVSPDVLVSMREKALSVFGANEGGAALVAEMVCKSCD